MFKHSIGLPSKSLNKILCSFALATSLSAQAFVPERDLADANVVSQAMCGNTARQLYCVSAVKGNVKYIVMFDNIGFILVVSVKEFKERYTPEEVTLVWKRGDVET